jgi:hypothetical protein
VLSLVTYSDGGIFQIDNLARTSLPLRNVSNQYNGQGFHLELLNRGTNLITVYFKPLLGPEQAFEVPQSSPGVVLDNLPWDEFFNGIEAQASTAPTNLLVKLYSNYLWKPEPILDEESLLVPRDTYLYPNI